MMILSNKCKQVSNNNAGFVALVAIIIVSVAAFMMAYSASLLGIGELDLGYTYQKGRATSALAEGCLAESLQRLKLDTGYAGGELVTDTGSCTIEMSGVGNDRTIVVEAEIESRYYRHLTVDVTLSGTEYPQITVANWREGI